MGQNNLFLRHFEGRLLFDLRVPGREVSRVWGALGPEPIQLDLEMGCVNRIIGHTTELKGVARREQWGRRAQGEGGEMWCKAGAACSHLFLLCLLQMSVFLVQPCDLLRWQSGLINKKHIY